ncbi:MAG: hypothetical protein HUK20_00510, partial [Fibrobacter sp.]|nr:hypothetical protein [Fibrobacter sp.]
MGWNSKILFTGGLVAFAATWSLAQTVDLPIIFVDTKQKCLDKNVSE